MNITHKLTSLFAGALCVLLLLQCGEEPLDQAVIKEVIAKRNSGLALLEEGRLNDAANAFQKIVELVPREASGYANLGLIFLRNNKPKDALQNLKKAYDLNSDNPNINLLLATAYELNGESDNASEVLEHTLTKNPNHARTIYRLLQRELNGSDPVLLQKVLSYAEGLVYAVPGNIAARLSLIELNLLDKSSAKALEGLEILQQLLPELPPATQNIFQHLIQKVRKSELQQARNSLRGFRNLLRTEFYFQGALKELRGTDENFTDQPVRRFSLAALTAPSGSDGILEDLQFSNVSAEAGLDSDNRDLSLQIITGDYDGDGDIDLYVFADAFHQLLQNNDGTFTNVASQAGIVPTASPGSAAFTDVNNDGYLDLFIASSLGSKLFQNNGNGTFSDQSAALPDDGAAQFAFLADLDLEGDLDIFLARSGDNELLRNNMDGTFTKIGDETGIAGIQRDTYEAVFSDFDNDGDIDVFAASRNGVNTYYDNLRQSYFRDITNGVGLGDSGGSGVCAAGDYNNDGFPDILTTGSDGKILLYRNGGDGTFQAEKDLGIFNSIPKNASLIDALFFDADNNGYLDILLAVSEGESSYAYLFMNENGSSFKDYSSLLGAEKDIRSFTTFDWDVDGDLDIALTSTSSGVKLLRNDGGNLNNYHIVQLTGLRSGSGKNNVFGIGSRVELQAGNLTQVRIVTEPVLHFGIGTNSAAEVVRVIWSNGVAQNLFNPEPRQTIVEDQILKGSCPWLYAWDGEKYTFVTDVLWSSALGMPLGIMSGEVGYASAASSNDGHKIPGELLKAGTAGYELRFTSELWEAIYVEKLKLDAIDYPDSLEVYIDEGFRPGGSDSQKLHFIADKRYPVSAKNERSEDVLPKLLQRDGNYVSDFFPGPQQGIVNLHDLILDPGDLKNEQDVKLFLFGWVFPTDASLNFNMGQSAEHNAIPPSLEVVNADGEWELVNGFIGFPKGKNKMMVVDLKGAFKSDDYRIRIRTNMQIYWDEAFFGLGDPEPTSKRYHVPLLSADLRYRGYSEVSRKDFYSPHIPDYQVITTGQKWRDLTGNYTRYGNVLPLLAESDNRYVIMNGGDELALTFEKDLPNLAEGMRRDFLFYNDGWVKDGDLNTAYGQTVDPYPFLQMESYPYPDSLNPVNSKDFESFLREYNTRIVTTDSFRQLLFQTN